MHSLPICIPRMISYQYQAYGQAIVMANEVIKNFYYNHYIQMRFKWKDFFETGFDSQYTPDKSTIVELPVLDCNVTIMPHTLIDAGTLIDFMIGQLLTEHYIYLFNIDEFYIDNTPSFKERHFLHDNFIYGFDIDKQEFLTLCYTKQKKFDYNKLPFSHLKESIQSQIALGQSLLYTIKASDAYCPLDIRKIRSETEQYLYNFSIHKMSHWGSDFSLINDGWNYGIQFYEYLQTYMDLIKLGKFSVDQIDMRVFRMLLEHKVIMEDRVDHLSAMKQDFTLKENIREIVQESEVLLNLTLKTQIKDDIDNIDTIKEHIESIYKKDIDFCQRFTQYLTSLL